MTHAQLQRARGRLLSDVRGGRGVMMTCERCARRRRGCGGAAVKAVRCRGREPIATRDALTMLTEV